MNPRTEDPAQADRAWAGYHPRAAVPTFAVAAAGSLLVWTGRWYLDDLSDLAERLGALAVFALAWCVWPGLLARYAYRAITYTYHVTDRAIHIDFGFWHRPVPPVWLNQIADVRSGAGWLSKLLGVGWVEVRTADRVVRLVGVRNPRALAEQLRAAITSRRSLPPYSSETPPGISSRPLS